MKRLLVVVVSLLFAQFLSACSGSGDCKPEGDRELCGDRTCGVAFLVDSCGERREVECGGCGENEDCEENQCVCTPEEDRELCGQAQAICGDLVVQDRCGEERQLNCGECAAPWECEENQCVCEGESEEELCEAGSYECGETEVRDRCGEWRAVECGECTGEREQCVENLCRCDGESDSELCASQAKECGEVELVDACGESRMVDCGFCEGMGEECVEYQCICEAESDEVLCSSEAGLCGDQEFVDRCGDTRHVECEPCAVGSALFGAVRNAETGELIEDALIRVYDFPPEGGDYSSWEWPQDYRANDPDFGMTSRPADQALTDQINYEFGTQGSICLPDGEVETLEKDQWYRIRVDRSGFQPGFFYYQHKGYGDEACPSTCLPSAESRCHRLDFELWPDDAVRPLYPDLWIDVRALNDHEWQCAIMPDGHPYERIIALRITSGIANVGPGPYHLEGVEGSSSDERGLVMQNIHWSDGTMEPRQIESEFFDYYQKQGKAEFVAWVRLALVDPTEACDDVDNRSSGCVSHETEKISFCLHDSDRFDEDIMAAYDGMVSRFTNPPACDGTAKEQGITPGWKDTYGYTLPEQVVIMGPPSSAAALGKKWVEMEIDPRKVLHQTSRAGTLARLHVDITEKVNGLCDDPEAVIDCTPPREEYTTHQRWFCPNYIRYRE